MSEEPRVRAFVVMQRFQGVDKPVAVCDSLDACVSFIGFCLKSVVDDQISGITSSDCPAFYVAGASQGDGMAGFVVQRPVDWRTAKAKTA